MLVGTIGSPRRAHLDGAGQVTVGRATPDEITIGWLIGAEDRWYVPDREVTVRQSLVQGSPVIMTSVRIPGGDANETVFGAVQGQRELVVIDVANKGRAPIVWALTISGAGSRRVTVDGSTLRVDGFALVTMPRPPMLVSSAPTIDELVSVVTSGGAHNDLARLASNDDGVRAFAFLVPVSQSTSVRAAVLIGASSSVALGAPPVLSALPDVHTAASGWGVHIARGPQLTGVDRQITANLQSAIGGALLASEPLIADSSTDVRTRAVSARAFDALGLRAESGALLENIDEFQRRGGLIDDGHFGRSTSEALLTSALTIDALCHHAWVTQDAVFAETLAPAVAGAAEALVKAARKDPSLGPLYASLGLISALFAVAGDVRAAKQAYALWERLGRVWPMPAAPLPALPASSSGASFVPDQALRLAAFGRSAAGVVSAVGPDGVVDLFPGFESGWRGTSFEARNVPVPGGQLSVAVRWHGERPALLWEGTGSAGLALRCSSIDPSWSATGLSGEALLAFGS